MPTRVLLYTTKLLILSLLFGAPIPARPQALPAQVQQWSKECEAGLEAGQYSLALTACQKLVDAMEQKAPGQPQLAEALNNLGAVYFFQGMYQRAEQLYLRSLHIWEQAFNPKHPEVAQSLNNLAELYRVQGEYAQAEPLYLRSLEIRRQTLSPDDPAIAQTLNNLATLYQDQGEPAQAKPLLLQSLQIREKKLGPDHPQVATALNNLGLLYKRERDYQKAEPLFLRSLHIREKALGPDHPHVAVSLNNLALLYDEQDKYLEAERLYLRSLQIRKKVLGQSHPDVAVVLNNLGLLYNTQGQYQRAEPLLLRGLSIRERALGVDHPDVALSLRSLTLTDVASGRATQALPRLARALAIHERALRNAFTESRVASLLDKLRGDEDSVYSFLLRPDVSSAASYLSLQTCLLRKGRAAEAGLITGRALWESLTSSTQRQRFEQWQALRVQRETLRLRGPGKESLSAHQSRLTELDQQIDTQEEQLARAVPGRAAWKLPSPDRIIAEVAKKLSRGSALVEVVWMRPRQFPGKGADQKWGESRYVALILFPDEQIEFVDLGPAEQMDQAAAALLSKARNEKEDPRPEAQALHRLLFAPLASKLHNATKLFLSLDGSLNLVPFAALHDGHQYLLDSTSEFIYLSSGRDLLREPSSGAGPPVVLADPAYWETLYRVDPNHSHAWEPIMGSLYDVVSSIRPLAASRQEGLLVSSLLKVRPLLDAAATEEAIRKAKSAIVLHIVTHGVFLDGSEQGAGRSLVKLGNPGSSISTGQLLGRSKDYSLSHSALFLAGAVHAATAPDAAHDGILTAEEARSLNLFGTKLVVLSACDTGRGSVKVGQGVYGLRRAFFVAGAETVVMSLWSVSDPGTKSLMERYYQLLFDRKAPRSRVTGLAEAMRMVKAEHSHPYYWAPFIALGRDAPLVL